MDDIIKQIVSEKADNLPADIEDYWLLCDTWGESYRITNVRKALIFLFLFHYKPSDFHAKDWWCLDMDQLKAIDQVLYSYSERFIYHMIRYLAGQILILLLPYKVVRDRDYKKDKYQWEGEYPDE